MGDWMTVQIKGTCAPEEVAALRKAVDAGPDYANFHCLCGGLGVFGLPNWARPNIDVAGNCAERNYNAESVAETLAQIAKAVPSLAVKVHCGGAYESKECVATVTLANGKATIGPPEIERLEEFSDDDIEARFLKVLLNPRHL